MQWARPRERLVVGALVLWAALLFSAVGYAPARWVVERLPGLPGGAVREIILHPTDEKALLVVTTAAPYLTLDHGETWRKVDLPAGAHPTDLRLQFDAQSPTTLYLAGAFGVAVSQDGGARWRSLPRAPQGPFTAFAVSPADGALYAATPEEVWRSADQGKAWQPIPLPCEGERVLTFAPHPQVGGLLYAGTSRGLYVSGDRGETWHIVKGGLPLEAVRRIAFSQAEAPQLYVETERGLYLSTDGGAHWEPFAFAPAAWPPLHPQEKPLAGTWDPSHPERLYLGTSHSLYASADGGRTWADIGRGLTAGAVRDLAWGASSGRLYALGTVGLYAAAGQGKAWEQVSNLEGLTAAFWVALAAGGTPEALFLADQTGVFSSADGGRTWHPLPDLPPLEGEIKDLLLVEGEGTPTLCVVSSQVACWDAAGWHALNLEGAPLAVAAHREGSDSFLYLATEQGLYRVPTQGAQAWRLEAVPHPSEGKILALLSRQGEGLLVGTDRGSLYACNAEGCKRLLAPREAATVEQMALVPPRQGRLPSVLALLPDGQVAVLEAQGRWRRLFTPQEPNTGRFVVVEDPSAAYWVDALGGVWRLAPRVEGYAPWAVGLGAAGLLGALGVAAARWRRKRRGPAPPEERWDDIITEALMRHHRVTPEMLVKIPSHARLHAMARYVDGHRHQALTFQEEPPLIRPAREAGLRALAQDWAALRNALGDPPTAEPIASRVVERICTLLGFDLIESRVYRDLAGYMVEAPTLRLSLPARFPILVLLKEPFEKEDLRHIRALMSALNAVSFFALLVRVNDPGEAAPAEPLARQWLREGAEDLVLLEYRDLCELYLAADAESALTQQILSQVDLTVVSPYVLSGPVPPKMFFGRDYEIKVILRTIQDRSFAIVGGRKIGKTSILNKVHRLLQQMAGFVPLYLDCHHVTTYEGFFEALAVMCDVSVESPSPEMLRRIVVRLRARHGETGHALVFLLDEVDHLLRYDLARGTLLFRVFRSLSQEGLCRFIFCGERVLDAALRDPNSPLYNFCSVLRLGYLQERDAERIVQEPMKDMGISFEAPERIPREIVSLSGCHPNIVQVICQLLIERLNQRGDRIIREADLEQLKGSVEFKDMFFEISWGNATTLERLITVLMVEHARFTPAHIRGALLTVGVPVEEAQLEEALNGLLLASLFRRRGTFFEYTSEMFPRLLREAGLAEGFREGLLAKWQEERSIG